MTFFDILSSLSEGIEGEELNIGTNMLAPIVQQGVTEGLSANQMYNAVQSAGIGIRRSSFLDLVGGVRESVESAGAIASAPLDQLPATDDIVEWRGGRANTYLYRTNVFVRERDAEGNFHFTSMAWDLQTDSLMTPQDVADAITDQFEDNEDEYGSQLLGVTLRGVYSQTGRT